MAQESLAQRARRRSSPADRVVHPQCSPSPNAARPAVSRWAAQLSRAGGWICCSASPGLSTLVPRCRIHLPPPVGVVAGDERLKSPRAVGEGHASSNGASRTNASGAWYPDGRCNS